MEIIGYLASALIGISLGLIGGGGSILTVPVLVYLFGVSPALATSYSLFIVGTTSLMGTAANLKKKQVDIKTALLFGSPSIITVFITRKIIIPMIPQNLFYWGSIAITRGLATMVLFAILMLAASAFMITGKKAEEQTEPGPATTKDRGKLVLYGITIGFVTGLLGAGGGFLIIPTLVILAKLPMKKAVGTSLMIMTMSSLIGFSGDRGNFATNWNFLLNIASIAVAGILVGGILSKRIPGAKLKKGFGWFVMIMGAYIILREVIMK